MIPLALAGGSSLLGEPIMSDVPGLVVVFFVMLAFLAGFLVRGFLDD